MNGKNLVIVTQYYPPEIGGGAHRSLGFAEELAALGMNVTVVTAFPSYLIHKKHAHFRFKPFEKQQVNGLTVYRTFVIPSDRGNFLLRLLYYISFTISSTLLVLWKLKQIDTLLSISPPLFTGVTGVLAKKFKSARFILDIGDLWPESAVQLKILKNPLAIRFSQSLERWIYDHCDGINLVTQKTLDHFRENHRNGAQTRYVPNFVDPRFVTKKPKDSAIVERLGLRGKLVFGYVGNIGVAQGMSTVVQAAHRTRHIPGIAYVIVGDGVEYASIEREIRDLELDNIHLLPPVSREEVMNYISVVDVMIIPLINAELFKITIPSKLYESMAAEVPVILSVDGEARAIVEQSNCGVCVQPECVEDLADQVIRFYNNPRLIPELGRNGRTFVQDRYARDKVMRKYYHELMTIGC